jgi:hypothetical protein
MWFHHEHAIILGTWQKELPNILRASGCFELRDHREVARMNSTAHYAGRR